MKRLLCIVGSMDAGGAETFLMKLYRKMDLRNYQMDFAVAVKEKGYYDDEIISMGGKIFHIPPKSESLFKNFTSIIRIVKEEKYNSVLRTSQHSLSALELLAARIGGAKKLIFRSSNSNTTTGKGLDVVIHRLCSFMPLLFSNVRIAPSTEAAEFMFGKKCLQKKKAYLLHNGLDLDTFRYDPLGREVIRRTLGIDNCVVLGHVGRFNQQKNHDFVVDVFKEFLKINPDARLMLVGKGELQDRVRSKAVNEKIIDKVIFMGIRNDIPRVLSAMDVFLFPSLSKSMPNTVVEAQSTGLPCVISSSITREAAVTNLVSYIELDSGLKLWITALENATSVQNNRGEYNIAMKANGYDINDCVNQFIELAF